jgi:hypothetical protein
MILARFVCWAVGHEFTDSHPAWHGHAARCTRCGKDRLTIA